MPSEEPSREELLEEIRAFCQQVLALRQEKIDLEVLIETHTKDSDLLTESVLYTQDFTKSEQLTKIRTLCQEISQLQWEVLQLQYADSVREDQLERVATRLRENERCFRVISETVSIPIIVSCYTDHTAAYANEPTSLLFESPWGNLKKHTFLNFYDLKERQQLLRTLAVSCSVSNFRFQGKKTDGTSFYGMLYAHPLYLNKESCLLHTVYDMPERKNRR